MTTLVPEKITPLQRSRDAYVYVRQSTPKQVLHNRESQFNQYALVQRAIDLGWLPDHVHVIDADLGHSGQDSQRPGFQELVAAVSLGQVGIILAYEASRLARNNSDWYTLLDLATMVGTLIADPDGVYDPRQYNDRLLLGLRGILSEAELHLLHLRMDAGRRHQIEQGTYRQHLPTGLLRLPDGRVIKDPDQQVQHTIDVIFERFARLGSCQKLMRNLRDAGILLPRRQHGGLQAGQLLWRKPNQAALTEVLHNPAYAGAFVYGRRVQDPQRRAGQHRQVRRPLEEWATIHQGTYPAYISWEQFLANQAQLADNASAFARRARAAPRDGSALLAGLVVCGRCGYQMHVTYKPQQRYSCTALAASYGAATCLHIDGASLEAVVVDAFFAALAPAELDLLEEVLARQQTEQAHRAQCYNDSVKRAEYEARLAQRQYQAVDPDNRLVAAELERRWEVALQGWADAQAAAEAFARQPATAPLSGELKQQLRELSRSLPELWQSRRLSHRHQKELLRSLIRRVVVRRPAADTIEAQIVWVSGAISAGQVHPRVLRQAEVSGNEELERRVLELGGAGYADREIARRLSAEGYHSARSEGVAMSMVSKIRRRHGQVAVIAQFKSQAKIEGQWTVQGLAEELGVHRNWLYARVRKGMISASRHEVTGHYLIPDDPQLIEQLRGQRDRCCYC